MQKWLLRIESGENAVNYFQRNNSKVLTWISINNRSYLNKSFEEYNSTHSYEKITEVQRTSNLKSIINKRIATSFTECRKVHDKTYGRKK